MRRLGRRQAARLAGTAWAGLLLPSVLVAAPFWSVSALTRLLSGALPLERPSATSRELLVRHPTLGQHSRPSLTVRERVDNQLAVSHRTVTITTDDEGWRDRSVSLDDAEVVAFGDGFAFGSGVVDGQLFTRIPAHIRCKSLGCPATSMVHSVLLMEELGHRLAGKTLLWLIYLGNDLYDNLRPNLGSWRVPYVRRRGGSWQIAVDHLGTDGWPFDKPGVSYRYELARLCTGGAESQRAFDAAGYLIGRAHGLSERVGAKLCIMTVPKRSQIDPSYRPELRSLSPAPDRFDARRPDIALGERCATDGIPFVPLFDHLTPAHYQPTDRLHWNRAGHATVGGLVARAHEQAWRGGR
jgi:hypothetical protein